MAKLTLTDISAGYDTVSLSSANNTATELALENTLSRDGTSPNQMEANIDMNSNRINNLADGVNLQDAVTVNQLTGGTVAIEVIATYVNSETSTDGQVIVSDGNGDAAWETLPYLENVVEDLTPELGGDLACADQEVQRPEIIDYGITSTSPSSSAGTLTLDWENGNSFQVTLTEDVSTVTISNPPATGTFGEIIIKFIQDSTGSWTVTWPASVKWPGGTGPVITTTATTGTDCVSLKTWDGGTTYYGDFSQDYS